MLHDTTSKRMSKSMRLTAWISIALLSIIIGIASWRLVAWRKLKARGDMKIAFHRCLLVTCVLELPLWILCVWPHVIQDPFSHYPQDPFFTTAYACHLVALPGYFVCVGIIGL